jgi:hypothetical protein
MQDPHDTVKAKLPESESPAVELHTHCYNAYYAVPSSTNRSAFAVRNLQLMGDG